MESSIVEDRGGLSRMDFLKNADKDTSGPHPLEVSPPGIIEAGNAAPVALSGRKKTWKKRKLSAESEQANRRRSSRRLASTVPDFSSSTSSAQALSVQATPTDLLGDPHCNSVRPEVDSLSPENTLRGAEISHGSAFRIGTPGPSSLRAVDHVAQEGTVAGDTSISDDRSIFTPDNYEDYRLWNTRSSLRAYAKCSRGANPQQRAQSAHNIMKKMVLPRNEHRRDPNSVAGLGIPLKGSLNDCDGSELLESPCSSETDELMYNADDAGLIDDSWSITAAVQLPRPPQIQSNQGGRRRVAPKEKALAALSKETERAEVLYKEWERKKDRINELLSIPFYSASPRYQPPPKAEPKEGQQSSGPPVVPDGYNLTMEDGLCVFSPTPEVFADFEAFLETVEEIAGRENGVVKVVVPHKNVEPPSADSPLCTSATRNTDSPGQPNNMAGHNRANKDTHYPDKRTAHSSEKMSPSTVQLSTFKLGMFLNQHTQSSMNPIYDVTSRPWHGESASLERARIEDHRRYFGKYCGLADDQLSDIWRFGSWQNIMGEEKLIQRFMDEKNQSLDTVYGMDNDATPDLREALSLGNLKLVDFPGNSLMKSSSRIEGIHTPYFYVSHDECTPFGLHVEDYGAYSMNYLHVGAPKCWYVIKPKHQKELEEFLHGFSHPSETLLAAPGTKRPRRPPQCSQFLRHQSMFLPEETLRTTGLEFTRVVQQQGQMVITFPWAYHQGFNSGPNIAEAIGYASERWEIFMREGLYQKCHRAVCLVEPLNMDFDFVKPRTTACTYPARKPKGGRARAGMATHQPSRPTRLEDQGIPDEPLMADISNQNVVTATGEALTRTEAYAADIRDSSQAATEQVEHTLSEESGPLTPSSAGMVHETSSYGNTGAENTPGPRGVEASATSSLRNHQAMVAISELVEPAHGPKTESGGPALSVITPPASDGDNRKGKKPARRGRRSAKTPSQPIQMATPSSMAGLA